MYLKEITLKNFKGLAHSQLTFQPGFNLVVGNNGVGKTSILEGISIGIASFFAATPGLPTKGIVLECIRSSMISVGDGSIT